MRTSHGGVNDGVCSTALRTRGVLALGVTAAVLAASRVCADGDFGFAFCLFRRATSLPCPSCGMTRAFCALSHGDVVTAVERNAASPLVYAAVATIALFAAAQAASGRDWLGAAWSRVRRPLVKATLVAMSAAWTLNLAGRFGR